LPKFHFSSPFFPALPIFPALPNLPEKISFISSLYEGYTYPLGRAKESRRAGAAEYVTNNHQSITV